jgi:methionyl-tRNA formyltransferase
MTRAILFAYSEIGTVALEELTALPGVEVALLFTHEDDPEETIFFRTPASLARERGIPVRTDDPNAPGAIGEIRALAPDLILSAYYRSLIAEETLGIPRLGAFNLHGSLLPKYRGRAPINWAVLRGETETGVTLHVMTGRADAGDIVDAERVPIGPEETAHQVFLRMVPASRALFRRALPLLLEGRAPRTPQDESAATRFGRRRPEDGRIDWGRPAREIHDLVRAVAPPYPGAFATLPDGTPLRILRTRLLPDGGSSPASPTGPGRILSLVPFRVVAGDGRTLEILDPTGGDVPERLRIGDVLR